MPGPTSQRRDVVLVVAVVMILAATTFRGWALAGGWFYGDDLPLLAQARRPLTLDYLMDPHGSHVMPWGRALVWVVGEAGLVNWPVAVATTLITHLLAALSCLWMLLTLFGARFGVLALLALFLASAMTLPATMWWAVALNAYPMQMAYCCAVAAWVLYLRTRRRRWLVLTLAAFTVGLSGYIKALLIVPLLAGLALAYFAEGHLLSRLRQVLRRAWLGVAIAAVLVVGYLAYYVTHATQVPARPVQDVAGRLAEAMLAEALPSALLGGPWQWASFGEPAMRADPPGWAVHGTWVVLAFLVAYVALRRVRTGRAWCFLVGHAAASYALLLFGRAPDFGPEIGYEYRYLTDVVCSWVLVLGLVSMRVIGSTECSAPRREPLLRVRVSRRAVALLVAAVAASSTMSALVYVRHWHATQPMSDYFAQARAGLSDTGPVDFAEHGVPDRVLPGFFHPANLTTSLLPVVVDNARFPKMTARLAVLADDGTPSLARIDAIARTQPGPVPGCGWQVADGQRVSIPLTNPAMAYPWWLRIGYLSSTGDRLVVDTGSETFEVPIRQGLNDAFVAVEGRIEEITLSGLERGTTLCVDVVEIGTPVPGGPL